MIILVLRTDQAEAQIGLFNDSEQLELVSWQAHRQLAETIHHKIEDLLTKNNYKTENIDGFVGYLGPGSFTGLRIGLSVINALADSTQKPIVGAEGQDWIKDGIKQLLAGKNDRIVLPEYGSPPHITPPKK